MRVQDKKKLKIIKWQKENVVKDKTSVQKSEAIRTPKIKHFQILSKKSLGNKLSKILISAKKKAARNLDEFSF